MRNEPVPCSLTGASGGPSIPGPMSPEVHRASWCTPRRPSLPGWRRSGRKGSHLTGLPRDPSSEFESARRSLGAVENELAMLRRGEGPRATAEIRHLAEEAKAAAELRGAAASAAACRASRLDRWRARRDLPELLRCDAAAEAAFGAAINADEVEFGARAAGLRSTVEDLGRQVDLHRSWHAARPEVRLCLHHLDRAIAALEPASQSSRSHGRWPLRWAADHRSGRQDKLHGDTKGDWG